MSTSPVTPRADAGPRLDADTHRDASLEPEAQRPLGAPDSGPKQDAGDAKVDTPDGEVAVVPDGGPAPAARCTGKPGTKQGKTEESIRVGNTTRKFVMHRPASLDPNKPAPIVFVPHGYTQTGSDMYRITRYWELGEKEGVVTIYPEGASFAGPWNVGQPSCQSVFGLLPLGSADDQAFLAAMVDFVAADQCVDRDHIFLAGFSMGAYFTNESACLGDLVRAIAPHSGGSHDFATCKGKRKPVLLFHGNADKLIPYDCGKETRERWVKRNGCSMEVETKKVTNGMCEVHKGCPADAQVTFCTLDNMNHGWAGGAKEQVATYPDDYPKFESFTQASWEFFKQHAW
jgi:poly(3-hydroxybutyrate) depolymerase